MNNSRSRAKRAWDRLWPYIPLITLAFLYLVAGFGQSLAVIREARYAVLGVVTLPLFIALIIVGIRIMREQKQCNKKR